MSGFTKGDLKSTFAAQNISFDEPEAPAAERSYDPNIVTVDPNEEYTPKGVKNILERADNNAPQAERNPAALTAETLAKKAAQLEEKRKNFSHSTTGNEAAGLQEVAQEIGKQNKAQQEKERQKTRRAVLLAQLMNTPEFKDYQIALDDFKDAVDAVQDNQATIDSWKDALLKAEQEQQFDELKTLLQQNGYDTNSMSEDELIQAGMQKLVASIDKQGDLIAVMKQKAEIVQAKLDAVLDIHPELRDDPDFIRDFMEPHVKELQAMQAAIEAQDSNLDFAKAQEQVARTLDGKNTLLNKLQTDVKADIYAKSTTQKSPETTPDNTDGDLAFFDDPQISSFAPETDEAPADTQRIKSDFNAAAQGQTPDEPEAASDKDATISINTTGFKPGS